LGPDSGALDLHSGDIRLSCSCRGDAANSDTINGGECDLCFCFRCAHQAFSSWRDPVRQGRNALTRGLHTSLQQLLESGVDFHGHLGPYLVLGLRMGRHAVRKLRPKRLHEMTATVWTSNMPPQSCVLDGVQVSSGCTFGKRNIRVRESKHTRAEFRKGSRTIVIEPTEKAATLLSRVSAGSPYPMLREIALTLYGMPDRELLNVA